VEPVIVHQLRPSKRPTVSFPAAGPPAKRRGRRQGKKQSLGLVVVHNHRSTDTRSAGAEAEPAD
jgi:hypothetical protein